MTKKAKDKLAKLKVTQIVEIGEHVYLVHEGSVTKHKTRFEASLNMLRKNLLRSAENHMFNTSFKDKKDK